MADKKKDLQRQAMDETFFDAPVNTGEGTFLPEFQYQYAQPAPNVFGVVQPPPPFFIEKAQNELYPFQSDSLFQEAIQNPGRRYKGTAYHPQELERYNFLSQEIANQNRQLYNSAVEQGMQGVENSLNAQQYNRDLEGRAYNPLAATQQEVVMTNAPGMIDVNSDIPVSSGFVTQQKKSAYSPRPDTPPYYKYPEPPKLDDISHFVDKDAPRYPSSRRPDQPNPLYYGGVGSDADLSGGYKYNKMGSEHAVAAENAEAIRTAFNSSPYTGFNKVYAEVFGTAQAKKVFAGRRNKGGIMYRSIDGEENGATFDELFHQVLSEGRFMY